MCPERMSGTHVRSSRPELAPGTSAKGGRSLADFIRPFHCQFVRGSHLGPGAARFHTDVTELLLPRGRTICKKGANSARSRILWREIPLYATRMSGFCYAVGRVLYRWRTAAGPDPSSKTDHGAGSGAALGWLARVTEGKSNVVESGSFGHDEIRLCGL